MLYVLKQETLLVTAIEKRKMKELVLIGEKKEYEPLSREVFIKRMNKRKF